MSKAMRQMPEPSGRAGVARGEAVRDPVSDEASDPPREHRDTGSAKPKAGTGGLLEAALTRENLNRAWKRVKANKGAAGVDGLGIEQTAEVLRTRWTDIRQTLLAGTYRPQPVRKVMIPKPDGSQRELGIPTVLDRLIQQALLQVLQALIDPSFSDHSHGFRPGRRARMSRDADARQRIGRVALSDLLHRAAQRFGARCALVEGGHETSFAALDADACRFAQALLASGLALGDRAAMLCDNSEQICGPSSSCSASARTGAWRRWPTNWP